MRINLKKTAAFFIICVSAAFINAAELFNSNLSSSEKKSLQEGSCVIRNTGKYKKICINSSADPVVERGLKVLKKLDPNYLAEIIQIYPYEGNEDLLLKIDSVIKDIPSYAGIPYWSEQHQRYFDLYSKATVKSSKTDGAKTELNADLVMSPFGKIDTQIKIEQTSDTYYYESTNLNVIKYKGFKCLDEKKMKSIIMIFKNENQWVMYATGGCDAVSVPFLTSRIETSFLNRIKTFCSFCFGKI